MTKGLPRSLSRGPALQDEITKLTIPVNATVTVSATGAAVGFGSAVLRGLPEGNILLLGIVANLAFAGSGADANLTDTWSGNFGIGTTPADDATITAADVDILDSQAIGPATAEAIARARFAEAAQGILDNTDGSGEMNLNLLIAAADITDDTSVDITVTGELHVAYITLGDDAL